MFWIGVGVVVALVIASVVLLYVYGLAKATDESFVNVLGALYNQIKSGDYF